jgi:TRAP-type C4-dicarboxylate transport system permease small subunit
MQTLRFALQKLAAIEMAVCLSLLVTIVILILHQVVARYFFNAPLAWTEEFATYCFIWLVLISGALVAKENRHIVVDVWPDGPVRGSLRVITTLLAVIALGVVLANAAPIVAVELRTTTIALPLNFPKAYAFSLPMVYAFVSISLSMLVSLFPTQEGDQ